jgi:hypothetical protein
LDSESYSVWQKEPKPIKAPKQPVKIFPLQFLNAEAMPIKPFFVEERKLSSVIV